MHSACFNPRAHPHRVRPRASTARCVNLLFQSTHHTGCDVLGRSLHCNHAGFNPRTHTGCDSRHLADHCGCCRFNPRAHTGCDKKVAKTLLSYTCFNPRTHTGCDVVVSFLVVRQRVSIHAPTRGATLFLSSFIPE